jgi:membrane associated rhomboid family serine protease
MASFNSKSIFKFASKSDIIKIISITGLFFVVLQFTRLTFLINNESDAPFYTFLHNKLALPTTFKGLLYQPWSLITYMFSELNFMRILGNMIWLWIFATVIEDLKGSNRILPIYLVGGIVGAILMMTVQLIKPGISMGYYTGSLGSLSAVAIATLMFRPKYKFSMLFGLDIPIWVFVAIFFALNIATLQSYNLSLLFLVLGGSLVGLGYTNILESFFDNCTALFVKIGNFMWNNDNFYIKKEPNQFKNTLLNAKPNNLKKPSQSLDEVLDKINEKGIDSLTKAEKSILEEYGKSE